jgi:hypothetical protein
MSFHGCSIIVQLCHFKVQFVYCISAALLHGVCVCVCFVLISACNSLPPVGAVGVMQLSEPLLWFILRVLDKESALAEFNRMGGVKVCSSRIERVY